MQFSTLALISVAVVAMVFGEDINDSMDKMSVNNMMDQTFDMENDMGAMHADSMGSIEEMDKTMMANTLEDGMAKSMPADNKSMDDGMKMVNTGGRMYKSDKGPWDMKKPKYESDKGHSDMKKPTYDSGKKAYDVNKPECKCDNNPGDMKPPTYDSNKGPWDMKKPEYKSDKDPFGMKKSMYNSDKDSWDMKKSMYKSDKDPWDAKKNMYTSDKTPWDMQKPKYESSKGSWHVKKNMYKTDKMPWDGKKTMYNAEKAPWGMKKSCGSEEAQWEKKKVYRRDLGHANYNKGRFSRRAIAAPKKKDMRSHLKKRSIHLMRRKKSHKGKNHPKSSSGEHH